jgi:hypothetical protein
VADDDQTLLAVVEGLYDGAVTAAEPHLMHESDPGWRMAHWAELTDDQKRMLIGVLSGVASTLVTTARHIAVTIDHPERTNSG